MKILWPLAFLLFSTLLFAEGLSRNETGKLAMPHTDITLNASQKEELETLRTVTFTKEQWEALRIISPNTPKRLEHILPIVYGDCVCHLEDEAFGVLQKNGDLSVFHGNAQSPQDFFYKFNYAEDLIFHVDRRGQFFLKGTLVKFPILLQAIRESETNLSEEQKKNRPHRGTPSATIYTPIGADPNDAAYAERINEFKKELEAKGWHCSGPFPPEQ